MSESQKLLFRNAAGTELAGRLELPSGEPRTYAIFAHCFTCSKDSAAASRISRSLARHGIAVLRFDFTGLGGSDGDFANTSFSSNVGDLVSAAEHLRERFAAPQLLVGHSLGGAAVLAAAPRLEEVRAVCTIAAPSDPAHVRRLLSADEEEIRREGSAEVDIGGRPFRIARAFLDDLGEQSLEDVLGHLERALLVFHSPVDRTVGIEHARRIYEAARGFKSFVTLADADHLLSRKEDAEYVAGILSAWVERYLDAPPALEVEGRALAEGEVRVAEKERPFTNEVRAGRHVLLADEPDGVGGSDRGPDPYGYLLAGLGACTSMTLRMYADRKQWPLEHVEVLLRHARVHASDCSTCEDQDERVDRIEREVLLVGPELDDAQRARLLEIADRCPVHRTLLNQKEILTREASREDEQRPRLPAPGR